MGYDLLFYLGLISGCVLSGLFCWHWGYAKGKLDGYKIVEPWNKVLRDAIQQASEKAKKDLTDV